MRKVMFAAFPTSTRATLTNKSAADSLSAYSFVKEISTQCFLIAPAPEGVQNEGHSTVTLPIQERTICAPQKS
jgi:hypothetical protein